MMSDLRARASRRAVQRASRSGVKLLEQQYRDDPKFQGRMLVELGAGFRDNDETRRANELFQRGYEIGRAQHDQELMAYAQCSRAYGEGRADVRDGVIERLDEARAPAQPGRSTGGRTCVPVASWRARPSNSVSGTVRPRKRSS